MDNTIPIAPIPAAQIPLPPTPDAPLQLKAQISPVGALLKNSLEIYARLYEKLVGLVLIQVIAYLPFVIIGFVPVMIDYYGTSSLAISFFINVFLFIFSIISFYVILLVQGGIMLILKNYFLNNQIINIGQALKDGRPYVWPLFLVSLLSGIIIMLWSLLLIIPGIIFAVFYSFAVFALFFENFKSMSALRRSKELVGGYWWPVTLRYLALTAVLIVAYIILFLPSVGFEKESPFYIIWSLVMNIFGFLVGQVFLIYYALIYRDLVKIKGIKNA